MEALRILTESGLAVHGDDVLDAVLEARGSPAGSVVVVHGVPGTGVDLAARWLVGSVALEALKPGGGGGVVHLDCRHVGSRVPDGRSIRCENGRARWQWVAEQVGRWPLTYAEGIFPKLVWVLENADALDNGLGAMVSDLSRELLEDAAGVAVLTCSTTLWRRWAERDTTWVRLRDSGTPVRVFEVLGLDSDVGQRIWLDELLGPGAGASAEAGHIANLLRAHPDMARHPKALEAIVRYRSLRGLEALRFELTHPQGGQQLLDAYVDQLWQDRWGHEVQFPRAYRKILHRLCQASAHDDGGSGEASPLLHSTKVEAIAASQAGDATRAIDDLIAIGVLLVVENGGSLGYRLPWPGFASQYLGDRATRKETTQLRCALPQVPRPLSAVVGRERELSAARQALVDGRTVLLYGLPGVGKSVLAQEIASSFDGRHGAAIVDCRLAVGGGRRPVSGPDLQLDTLALTAIAPFVEGEVTGSPVTIAQELFADPARLLVLDNLEPPPLIRAFVERIAPARLVITSRANAAGALGQGVAIPIGVLGTPDAVAVFRHDARMAQGFDADITAICTLLGGLPLAVTVVASQLVEGSWHGDPGRALANLQRERFAVLERYDADTPRDSVRLAFDLSYGQLPPSLRRVFDAMGSLAESGAHAASVAWLLEADLDEVRRALDDLRRRSLCDAVAGERFRCHPLLWEYARHTTSREGSEATHAARLGDLADAITQRWHSRTRSYYSDEARAFLALHWDQYPALLRTHRTARQPFVSAISAFLKQTGKASDQLVLGQHALEHSRGSGDRANEAAQHSAIGIGYYRLSEVRSAIKHHEAALDLCRVIGDRRQEAEDLGHLGQAHYRLGEVHAALHYHRQALDTCREIGDRIGEGVHLGFVATAHRQLGDMSEAIRLYEQAISIHRQTGNLVMEGGCTASMGTAHAAVGDNEASIALYRQALEISRKVGNVRGEASHMNNLGFALSRAGDPARAVDLHTQALELARAIGDRDGEGFSIGGLGYSYLYRGDHGRAIEYLNEALLIHQQTGYRRRQAINLGNLGLAHAGLGQVEAAVAYHRASCAIHRDIADRLGQAKDLANLAVAHRQAGDAQQAGELRAAAQRLFGELNVPMLSADLDRRFVAPH